jgi:hypothetical protein
MQEPEQVNILENYTGDQRRMSIVTYFILFVYWWNCKKMAEQFKNKLFYWGDSSEHVTVS